MKQAQSPTAWQASDHDTLIEIKTLLTELSRKLDTFHEQLVDFEVRLRKIEELAIKTDPLDTHSRYDRMVAEWNDFKVRQRAYHIILGTGTGIFGSLVTFIIQHWLEKGHL